jgi:uncharacterized membrane protein
MKTYLTALTTFLIIDAIWLLFIANDLYQKYLGYILAEEPDLIAAGIFYLIFIYGLKVFAIDPAIKNGNLKKGLKLATLFGLVTYATYDLTSQAVIYDWPILITFIDMVWGMFVAVSVTVITYKIRI